jgi:hypothetical protein
VISAAALLSACGGGVADPAAAKVGSATIRRSTLDDQLSALAGNKVWIEAVDKNSEGDLSAPDGGVNTKLSAAWLGTMMNQVIIDKAFDRQHLKVTDKDRTAAKRAALELFAGQQTFDKFPRWFRDDALRKQERYAALAATVPPRPAPTEAQLREYFSRLSASLCPSQLAVLQIASDTPDAAAAIQAELAGGADFGTLAVQRSTDRVAGPNGGLAACKGTQQYQGLPEVERAAIDQLASGGVTAVVPVDSGFSVFKLVPWTFEIARPILAPQYNRQFVPPAEEYVAVRLSKAKIWVDPRYGKLERRGARVRIVPPVPPDPRSVPPVTPSSTAPAAATGQ